MTGYALEPERLTEEELREAYRVALEADDATLRWLLDQAVRLRPELAPVRDAVADEIVLRSARGILTGRIEVGS